MMGNKTDFDDMEKRRHEYLEKVLSLSSREFNPELWERLKNLVYEPRKLGVDVVIDDATLREGLQMAGMTSPKPVDEFQIARLLRDMGVERIELIMYSKTDQDAIKLMQKDGMGNMLAAWCRAATDDIDLALKLGIKQVGISHPVSFIHFVKWPETHLQELVKRVTDTVEYAKKHGLKIFVHGEDSTRADWDFEKAFINSIADAGADVYRICDTIGNGSSDPAAPLPYGIPEKIKRIKKETNIPHVEIHAHDDLGNAVENTMAAVRAASGLYDKIYVSTTFLGIGERSGNAETEKIILNCYMQYGIKKWNLQSMRELALFIKSSTNFHLPTNKAIVGDSSFSHESGIHLHGIEMLPLTYEIFPPELVGQTRTIVIGKRSGKHGVKLKLEEILKQRVDENDPRFGQLLDIIKDKFKGPRRQPVKDEEFKRYARNVGFEIEEKSENSSEEKSGEAHE